MCLFKFCILHNSAKHCVRLSVNIFISTWQNMIYANKRTINCFLWISINYGAVTDIGAGQSHHSTEEKNIYCLPHRQTIICVGAWSWWVISKRLKWEYYESILKPILIISDGEKCSQVGRKCHMRVFSKFTKSFLTYQSPIFSFISRT